jgi:hypothetical protein
VRFIKQEHNAHQCKSNNPGGHMRAGYLIVTAGRRIVFSTGVPDRAIGRTVAVTETKKCCTRTMRLRSVVVHASPIKNHIPGADVCYSNNKLSLGCAMQYI